MFTFLAVSPMLHGILLGALVIAILVLVLAGLIYLVNRFIYQLPPVALLITALAVLVGIVLWALSQMGISI